MTSSNNIHVSIGNKYRREKLSGFVYVFGGQFWQEAFEVAICIPQKPFEGRLGSGVGRTK
jgi:hypothetical protein